jgi:aspartyl-tRNA synthetase
MSDEGLEDFAHLLQVLRSGCPPHAGFALGFDRLIAILRGKESIRDVIAFPKSSKGDDPLVKSPSAMSQESLDTYHLQLKG